MREEWYEERIRRVEALALSFGFNDLIHDLIGLQTNNILLATWDQTTSQEVLKFPIIGPKMFWTQLLV
jgi:hypothetical protein